MSIVQDGRGFMWFGTLNGASRFDGAHFTHFTTKDGLVDNRIRFIKEDRTGGIWFGTDCGLSRLSGGKFTNYTTREGLVHDAVTRMHLDKSGALWVVTRGGVSRFAGEKFTNFTKDNGLPGLEAQAIIEDRQGSLLVIGRSGEVRPFTNGAFAATAASSPATGFVVQDALYDTENQLWLATESGLIKQAGGDAVTYTKTNGLGANRLNCVFLDVKGVLWAGTDGGGLSKRTGSQFITFTARNGLPNNRIYTMVQDAEGNLWVGTDAGATRLPGDWFANYTTDYGLVDNNIWAVHEDKSGNVWVGTAAGLSRLSNGRFTNYTAADGLPDNRVRALLEDREGDLWVGTDDGLARMRHGSPIPYTTRTGLVGNDVRALLEDRDGNLWVGTYDHGLSKFSAGQFTNFTIENGLPSNRIRGLAQDAVGNLWIATDGAGLVLYLGGKFTAYTTANGLLSNHLTCVTVDRAGRVWVGTDERGISRLEKGTFTHFTSEKGLSDNTIYFALEDTKGDLWFGTGRGVDRLHAERFKNYTTADGLAGNTVNPNAALRDQFGTLWFGTIFGLSQYNPEQTLDLATPPPIYLTRLQGLNKDHPLGPDLRLAPDENHLTLHFNGLSFRSPDRIRYQYILEGLDKNWSEPTLMRSVQYVGLEPGHYVFRVRAQSTEGVWSAQPARLAFTISPPLWRSWWFIALVLIAGGAAFYQFQRRYVRRYEIRHAELERMVAHKTDELQRQLAESQNQLKTLQDLYRAATLPVDISSMDRLLSQLISHIGGVFGPSIRAALLLLEGDRQHLRVRARHGSAPPEDRTDRLTVAGLGLTAYAARTGTAVNVSDVNNDPRYLRSWKDIKSELSVPLKVGARILGVIDLQSPEQDAFRERELAFMTSFAERAALAIWAAEFSEEASRTYGKLQDAQSKLVKAERLAALSQLGRAIEYEFNEPISTLLQCAERALQETRSVSPDLRQQIQLMYDSGKRLREILGDLEKVQDNAATYIDQTLMAAPGAASGPDLEVEDISIARLRAVPGPEPRKE